MGSCNIHSFQRSYVLRDGRARSATCPYSWYDPQMLTSAKYEVYPHLRSCSGEPTFNLLTFSHNCNKTRETLEKRARGSVDIYSSRLRDLHTVLSTHQHMNGFANSPQMHSQSLQSECVRENVGREGGERVALQIPGRWRQKVRT